MYEGFKHRITKASKTHILKFMLKKYTAERMYTYVRAPCEHLMMMIIIIIIIIINFLVMRALSIELQRRRRRTF